jgi:hypothetical protein
LLSRGPAETDKRTLSEPDICTKLISAALRSEGWGEQTRIREEVSFTRCRIIVRGKLGLLVTTTGTGKACTALQAIWRYRQAFPGNQPFRTQDQVSQRHLHGYNLGADPALSIPTGALATAGDLSRYLRESDEHKRCELVRDRGLAYTG